MTPGVHAIVDGTLDSDDPAVVAIGSRRVGCDELLAVRCTGTLIAPRLVLTAAHCVSDPRLGSHLEVMLGSDVTAPEARFHRVVEVARHPDYIADGDEADLAVLVLETAADAMPLAVATSSLDASLVGQSVRLVGFGQSSATGEPPGRKRTGMATVTELGSASFRIEAGPAMSCHGDSGGPVLAREGDAEVLAGVVSRGDPGCAAYGLNVRVDRFAAEFIEPWIAASMAPPSSPGSSPGSIPEDGICAAACTSDQDCPSGLSCRPGPDRVMQCSIPGLLAGDLESVCNRDEECDERCVRVSPDDESNACRCYRACSAAAMPRPDNGCQAAKAHAASHIWILLLITLVLRARRVW